MFKLINRFARDPIRVRPVEAGQTRMTRSGYNADPEAVGDTINATVSLAGGENRLSVNNHLLVVFLPFWHLHLKLLASIQHRIGL